MDVTPAQRTLALPELLDCVFAHFSGEECEKFVLVNRLWSKIALDHVWAVVESFLDLHDFFLFLVKESPSSESTDEAWSRFLFYSRRIRCIMSGAATSSTGSCAIFGGRIPQSLVLFPNLNALVITDESLDYDITENVEAIITHSQLGGILSLEFQFPEEDDSDQVTDPVTLLRHICTLNSGFKEVKLYFDGDVQYLNEAKICDALETLTSLSTVHLPHSFLSPGFLFRLKNHPNLHEITSTDDAIWTPEPTESNAVVPLPSGSFPLLNQLSGRMSANQFIQWLDFGRSTGTFSALTSFTLYDSAYLSTGALDAFFQTLGNACNALELIFIMRPSDFPECFKPDAVRARKEEVARIPLSTFSHLAELPKLIEINFTYPQPLNATDKEFAVALSKFPSLKNFHFYCEPYHKGFKPMLSLAVVRDVAELCPNLEELVITVDHTIPISSDGSAMPAFKHLKQLWLCTTLIEGGEINFNNIAFYISQLIPVECSIEYYGQLEGDPDKQTIMYQRFCKSIGAPIAQKLKASAQALTSIVDRVDLIQRVRKAEKEKYKIQTAKHIRNQG